MEPPDADDHELEELADETSDADDDDDDGDDDDEAHANTMEQVALLRAQEGAVEGEQEEEEDVAGFAGQYGLEDAVGVLQEAAAAGRRRDGGAAADEEAGRGGEWRQPLQLYLCILATALGAMGQGWAQTGINGANLYLPRRFGVRPLTLGVINASVSLGNAVVGSWLVAPANRRVGRRATVFVGAGIALVGNVAGAAAGRWQALLVGRLALGVGLGLVNSTLNIFAAESAPPAIRGGLGVAWQMFTAAGIFVGFLTNMLVDGRPDADGPPRWRLMLLAPAAPTVPLLLLIFACPESPAWLLKQTGHYGRAFRSLCRLRTTDRQAARELLAMRALRRRAAKTEPDRSCFQTLPELFTVPRVRRATLAAYCAQLAQQLCGINIVAFYSSTIFVEAHFTPSAAEMASTIFGLVNFLGAFPAVWAMDSLGRRSLLLLTLPPMAVAMGVAGASFSISEEHARLRLGLTTSMIYLFCLLYSPGLGPVPAAYSAEVFPLSHRELGASSAVAVASLFATALSLTFPWLLGALGTPGCFLLYALLNLLAWLLVFLFVPETKRRTLDDLDHTFSLPTRHFVRHQLRDVAPWWIRRYLLLQKHAKLNPAAAPQNLLLGAHDDDDDDDDN